MFRLIPDILNRVDDISRLTHVTFTRRNCSWCAWAWQKRLERGWSPLVMLMGHRHCHDSWKRYF